MTDARRRAAPTARRCAALRRRRAGQVRRRVLGPRSRCSPAPASWPARPASPTCSRPADVDELLSRRGLRTPFLRVAKQGTRAAGRPLHRRRRRRRRDRRPGARREGPAAVRGRRHAGAAGPAPDLAAADRLRPRARRRARPAAAGQRLPDPGRQPGLRHPLRHPRRVRAAGRRHASAGASTSRCCPTRWNGRRGAAARTRSPPPPSGEPALDVVLAPGDALYLPRGWLHSAEAQGEQLAAPDRRHPGADPVRVRRGTARRWPREDQRLRATLPFGLDVADPDAGRAGADRDGRRRCATGCRPPTRPRWPTRLRERAWPAARPAPIGPLAQLDFAAALDPGRPDRGARRACAGGCTADGAEHVVLRLVGRTLRFPAYCAPALRAGARPAARTGSATCRWTTTRTAWSWPAGCSARPWSSRPERSVGASGGARRVAAATRAGRR